MAQYTKRLCIEETQDGDKGRCVVPTFLVHSFTVTARLRRENV